MPVVCLNEKSKQLLKQIYMSAPRRQRHCYHASWLNMAEIEIGILDRQCLNRRLPDRTVLAAEVNAWQLRRNAEQRGITWTYEINGMLLF